MTRDNGFGFISILSAAAFAACGGNATAPLPQCGTSAGSATIGSLSREVGSSAGGTAFDLYGTGFRATDCVLLGSAIASITFVADTELSVVTPAHAAGVVDVRVVQNGTATATLTGGFDYEPAASVVYANQDFENGLISPFTVDSSGGGLVSITATIAHSGSNAVHCSLASTLGIARIESDYGGVKNPALTAAHGVYERWYVLVPDSSLTNSAAGQIKLHLSRVGGTQPPPGWFMIGEGSQFSSSPAGEVVAFGDDGIFSVPGSHTGVVLGNRWAEIETWYKRSGGVGHVRLWIDGKLKIDAQDANFGSDGSTDAYRMLVGLVYAQALTGPVEVYVDDVEAANGFIEPVP